MEQSLFARFAENLRDRRNTLVEWLGAASPEERQARLGPAPEKAMQNHFEVIERAIDKSPRARAGQVHGVRRFRRAGTGWKGLHDLRLY